MAPWARLKGVELQPSRSRVVLQLFAEPSLSLFAPPTRAISCGNPETMQLVYHKLQEVRAEYAERLTAQALAELAAQHSHSTARAAPRRPAPTASP